MFGWWVPKVFPQWQKNVKENVFYEFLNRLACDRLFLSIGKGPACSPVCVDNNQLWNRDSVILERKQTYLLAVRLSPASIVAARQMFCTALHRRSISLCALLPLPPFLPCKAVVSLASPLYRLPQTTLCGRSLPSVNISSGKPSAAHPAVASSCPGCCIVKDSW